jgi:hypothetical protein
MVNTPFRPILALRLNAVGIKTFADFVIYSRIELAVETKLLNVTSTLFGELVKAKLIATMSNTEPLLD